MNRSLPIVIALALIGCAAAKPKPLAQCTQKTLHPAGIDVPQYAPLDETKTFGPSQIVWFHPPERPNNCI